MRFYLTILICILSSVILFAQEKDNSKPTNLYSQVDNLIEYVHSPDYNTIGYNPKISYAPNDAFSFILEVPLRFNDLTQKFGLADVRLRTFYVPDHFNVS